MISFGSLCAGFLQLNFVVSANPPQVVVGVVRHDDIDVSRFANSGKVKHANLTVIDRNNYSLRTFNNGRLELCLVEICDGDCLLCDPAGTNECSRNRKALDDLQCERS